MRLWGYQRGSQDRSRIHILLACTVLLSFGVLCVDARADSTPTDLKSLSLEELINIEVTSASKKAEHLSEAAAAVYVITSDDIRRMGVTTIAEALRMAPGVQVSRIDGSTWAITSRGFIGSFANKLLVLIDNRSAYTPLFSGVYWDVQDVLLEDIDRIEVVRGPGGTLWGANAVNGVINVITKNSEETQGVLVTAGAGTYEHGYGAVRYGGQISNGIAYRAYAKYVLRDNSTLKAYKEAHDAWDVYRCGFRMDWKMSQSNSFMLLGDIYSGNLDRTYNFPLLVDPWKDIVNDETTISGGNTLGRWTHKFSLSSEMTIQAYLDITKRIDRYASERRKTFDIDIQHYQELSSRLAFLWGLGYRVSHDSIAVTTQSYAVPSSRTDDLYNAFVQMDFWFVPDRLRLSLGTKLEHNDYTGEELQPGVRLVCLASERHSLWAAVSRAVRTPCRVEHDAHIKLSVEPPMTEDNPSSIPALLVLTGNRRFKSEELTAYELGYRVQMSSDISLDMSLFNNVFEKLRSFQAGNPVPNTIPPTYVTVPVVAMNNSHGKTYGFELAADWRASDIIRFTASYSYLRVILDEEVGDYENELLDYERSSPRNQASIRSFINPFSSFEIGTGLRYMDPLPAFNIPSYLELDIRVGWKPYRNIELSLVGQNLLERYHVEYEPEFSTGPTYIERSVYGTIAWRY